MTSASQPAGTLEPHHLQMLVDESGIDPLVVEERGYRSILWANDLTQLSFARTQRRTPGLLLPVCPPDASTDLVVYRPDNPRVNKDGRVLKYEVPKGAGLRIDVPPRCRDLLGNPVIPLYVTEGIKKSDALASHGLCAVALLGVWSFITRNRYGGLTLSADLDHIACKGRVVRIVYDSDVTTKSAVRQALERFREHLQRKGAIVEIVYLPNGPEGAKVGVDDYLRDHTIAELEALAQGPRPAPQAAPQLVRLLDGTPARLDRPLAVIGEHAHIATWLHVEVTTTEMLNKSGEVVRFDPPRVTTEQRLAVVRDDGTVFGVDVQPTLDDLGFDVALREPLRSKHTWSVRGVARYRSGARPDAADVFQRLVASYDHFLDFDRSLASQLVMCRLMACLSLVTWFADQFDNVSYFQATGELGSGKTKLVEVWVLTSYLGQMVTSGSSFATLRDLADYGGALGIDEGEFLSDPKKVDPHLRELILSGYRKSGSEIALKELATDGSWQTRWLRTFSPRAFAAIKLPDPTLGSRTIAIPLVKSADRTKANRLPDHAGGWPVDRARLRDDLWALGLSLQANARDAWERSAAATDTLWGRDYEPWRPLLAVALLLEDNGVQELVADMLAVMTAYQAERDELVFGHELNRLVVEALAKLGETAEWEVATAWDSNSVGTVEQRGTWASVRVFRVVAADVARLIRTRLADDSDVDTSADTEDGKTGSGWPSAEQIGRALAQLRVGKRRKSGSKRWRELTENELQRLVKAHRAAGSDNGE